MYKLIERCIAGDESAWSELWDLYHHAAKPTRYLLIHAGFDESDADDIAVQVCTRLYDEDGKQLRSFNRDSLDELIVWLRRIAVNATRDWIKKGWRAKRRQRLRKKRRATPDRQTASLAEVESLLKELEADSVVSHDDLVRAIKIIDEPSITIIDGMLDGIRKDQVPVASSLSVPDGSDSLCNGGGRVWAAFPFPFLYRGTGNASSDLGSLPALLYVGTVNGFDGVSQ
jgi:DNA-directed RNA polymerase specialized sigma24 family protein